jgi:hypothetical protein
MRYVLMLVPLLAVGLAYQYVSRQIAVGVSGMGVPFAGEPVTLKPLEPMNPPFMLDSRELARLNGQNLADQTTRFNQHMEDIRNYARNPVGWHGRPPF